MTATIQLNRHIVEAAVIVGSILLAFAIDATWQSQQDNQREKQLLAAILSDMENNSIEIARIVGTNLEADRAMQLFLGESPVSLMQLTDRESAIQFVETSGPTPLGRLLGQNSFTPYLGSLTESNLADIQDLKLRTEIGTWLGLSADVVEATPRSYTESQNLSNFAAKHGTAVLSSQFMGLLPDELPEGIPSYGEVFSALRGDNTFISSFLAYHNQRKLTFRKIVRLEESTHKLISSLRGIK